VTGGLEDRESRQHRRPDPGRSQRRGVRVWRGERGRCDGGARVRPRAARGRLSLV